MLNFRNTNIFFIALLAVLIGVHITRGLPVYIYPIVVFIYSLIVFYGCYYIAASFFIKVVCSAKTDKKEIAISFDDGPAENYTAAVLAILKENNIPAAFFCIGKRIAGNEKLLKQIDEEGHIIGNHSFSHDTWFDLFSSAKMLADLQQMDETMFKAIEKKPKLFRPPYGVTNPNLKKAIIRGNYIPVGWNVRSFDTVIKDKKKLLDRISKRIQPGAVFLFHDTCASTLAALPAFIKEVKVRGYTFARLDKMLNLPTYA